MMENISMEVWKGQRSPRLHCEASGWGANTAVALGLSLGSGILLPLSFQWWLQNVNAQSVCQVNILFGLMGPTVLFSSQSGSCLFTACFNSLLRGLNCISFAYDDLLSIRVPSPLQPFKSTYYFSG